MGIFDQDNVNSGYSHTTSNTYDNLSRLTSAVTTGNTTYNLTFAYDRYGNMTCQTNAQTQGVCPNDSFDPSEVRGPPFLRSAAWCDSTAAAITAA